MEGELKGIKSVEEAEAFVEMIKEANLSAYGYLEQAFMGILRVDKT